MDSLTSARSSIAEAIESAVKPGPLPDPEQDEKIVVDHEQHPILVSVEVGHPCVPRSWSPELLNPESETRSVGVAAQGSQNVPARVLHINRKREELRVETSVSDDL